LTRMQLGSTAAILFLAIALVPAGCGEKRVEGPTILEKRDQPYVADVPVPKDFEIDLRKSTYENKPGSRYIKHIYIGKQSRIAINNFYKELMPEEEWSFVDEKLQNGIYTLNFEKGKEACEVRIDNVPGGLFGPKTRIAVEVIERQ